MTADHVAAVVYVAFQERYPDFKHAFHYDYVNMRSQTETVVIRVDGDRLTITAYKYGFFDHEAERDLTFQVDLSVPDAFEAAFTTLDAWLGDRG